MNSIELINKLTGLMKNLSPEEMLIPIRVNGVPVTQMYFSLFLSGDGDKYINLTVDE